MNDEVSFSKRKMLIALIVILSILLIAGVLVIARQISSAKKDVNAQSDLSTKTVAAIVSTTATASVTSSKPAVTPSATNSVTSAGAGQANIAATNFMQAKRDRSLGEAKQYMTDELYQNTDQVEFSGTSSPSMSRFELTSNSVKDSQTYKVTVKSYWLLQGQDAGSINYTLEVMNINNTYLVNKFDQN